MTKEQEIAELEELIASPGVPEDEKEFARQELAELKATAPASVTAPKTPPKSRKPDPCVETKAEKKKSQKKYEAKSPGTKVVNAAEKLAGGIAREAKGVDDKKDLRLLSKAIEIISREVDKVKEVLEGRGLSKEESGEFSAALATIAKLMGKKFEDGGKVQGRLYSIHEKTVDGQPVFKPKGYIEDSIVFVGDGGQFDKELSDLVKSGYFGKYKIKHKEIVGSSSGISHKEYYYELLNPQNMRSGIHKNVYLSETAYPDKKLEDGGKTPGFIDSTLADDSKDFPESIVADISHSNNPLGKYELEIADADGDSLGEYYYGSKEDAEHDVDLLEQSFDVEW